MIGSTSSTLTAVSHASPYRLLKIVFLKPAFSRQPDQDRLRTTEILLPRSDAFVLVLKLS